MLTFSELNEVKGLLHYLNENLSEVKPTEITLLDASGEPCAVIDFEEGEYGLARIY